MIACVISDRCQRKLCMKVSFGVLCVLAVAGCTGMKGVRPEARASEAKSAASIALPESLHWYRDSAEQRAIYVETYSAAAAAARALSNGAAPRSWGVILDVDETVLDNSEYQKRAALSGRGFES